MSTWFFKRPIAHRGLHHEEEVPENSLLAFEKAIENNYPIELDIQVTKDHEVVVFHDEYLTRLCKVDKKVSEMNLNELSSLRLYSTDQKIPTLAEVLKFVDGRVPLLIELKCLNFNGILERQTAKLFDLYNGELAIQSFHPLSLLWFKRYRETIPRGLLCGELANSKIGFIKKLILKSLLFTFLVKPTFFALEYNWFRPWRTKLFKSMPIIFWTITKDDEVLNIKKESNSNYIFEKILPKG